MTFSLPTALLVDNDAFDSCALIHIVCTKGSLMLSVLGEEDISNCAIVLTGSESGWKQTCAQKRKLARFANL